MYVLEVCNVCSRRWETYHQIVDGLSSHPAVVGRVGKVGAVSPCVTFHIRFLVLARCQCARQTRASLSGNVNSWRCKTTSHSQKIVFLCPKASVVVAKIIVVCQWTSYTVCTVPLTFSACFNACLSSSPINTKYYLPIFDILSVWSAWTMQQYIFIP